VNALAASLGGVVNLNGVEIYLEVADHTCVADRARTPLVFIHGMHSSREHWRYQVPAFSTDRPVVTWDLRGHGRSGLDAGSPTLADHVDDLVGLLAHLELSHVHVVGSGEGGFVAQQIALRLPDIVRSVTLVGSTARLSEAVADAASLARDIREQGVEAVYRNFVRRFVLGPRAGDALSEFVYRILAEPSSDAVAQRLGGMTRYEGREQAKSIPCPALIVAGELDGAFDPAFSRELRRLIPDSQLALIPHCGHLPQLEAAEVFNPMLRRFLAGVEAQEADS
jgi:3-oxoadipate enol-lactonase